MSGSLEHRLYELKYAAYIQEYEGARTKKPAPKKTGPKPRSMRSALAEKRREGVVEMLRKEGPSRFNIIEAELGYLAAKDLGYLRAANRVHRVSKGLYAHGPKPGGES